MAILHTDKILRVKNMTITSLIFLSIGIIGKIFNLTGTGYFLGLSITSTSYLFILFAREYSKTSNPNPQRIMLARLCYLTFTLALIGVIILFLRISGLASQPLASGIWMFRFSGLLFAYVCFNHYFRLLKVGKDSKSRLEGLILMFASASYLVIISLVIIAAAFSIKIGPLLIFLSLLLTAGITVPLLYLKAWFRNVTLTTLIIFNTSLNIFYFSNDEISRLFHKESTEQTTVNP
ncbi:MAG: hypothetical protein WCL14_11940 [Bacteroidota bacterium]